MHPDRFRPGRAELAWHGWRIAAVLAVALWLGGCAAPALSVDQPPSADADSNLPPVETAVVAIPAQPAQAAAQPSALETVLEYADRLRGMPAAELTQEINRLGDGGESAVRLMQLAIALAQTRAAANTVRAQALLQRVLGRDEPEARALHPLARLIAPQLAEARRADEQIERQAQQLRDAQRRIDVLNERLEAVRAIERSLPSPPASGASAPAPARP